MAFAAFKAFMGLFSHYHVCHPKRSGQSSLQKLLFMATRASVGRYPLVGHRH